jgi:hypothetical protein
VPARTMMFMDGGSRGRESGAWNRRYGSCPWPSSAQCAQLLTDPQTAASSLAISVPTTHMYRLNV